jgi:hypothetical protein
VLEANVPVDRRCQTGLGGRGAGLAVRGGGSNWSSRRTVGLSRLVSYKRRVDETERLGRRLTSERRVEVEVAPMRFHSGSVGQTWRRADGRWVAVAVAVAAPRQRRQIGISELFQVWQLFKA